MKKRIVSLTVAIILMNSLLVPVMAGEIQFQIGSPKVLIKNQAHILNSSPEIIKGTSFVPLKLVSEAFNVTLEWVQASKKIIMTQANERLELKASDYVITDKGRTLISIDFISKQFNQAVDYNAQTKKITLSPLVPPIAKFQLQSDPYITGRPFSFVNESYSPDASVIVVSLWEIRGNNQSIETKDLSKTIESLSPGTYAIKLKVKSAKGAWSQWHEESFEIKPHPKPIITSFSALGLEWDQGERIEFDYETIIEPWVSITETRWTYHKDGESAQTIGEPRALFQEGRYTISLEIKDNLGNWSLPAKTMVDITDRVQKTELEFKMENVRHGETFDNDDLYNFQNYDPVEDFTTSRGGPTLLFSNSPETVLQKGILYADKVQGDTRVLYHHRNGMVNSETNSRLIITVENKGNEPVTIRQTKKSTAGPSEDILHLGQIVTRRYFNSKLEDKITLQPKEKKYLYDTGKTRWPGYDSFSGVLEFNSDRIITVTVAAVDKDFDLSKLGDLPVVPRDQVHTRGTFKEANKYYKLSIPGDKPSKLLLGQKEDDMDSWLDGYDALTGAPEKNKGNYGVLYELELTGKENTGVLLNPRGTSFKGTFRWEEVKVSLVPAYGMFRGSQKASIVGVAEKRNSRKLYYTISNGSSGPVLFNFIPEAFWPDHKIEKKADDV